MQRYVRLQLLFEHHSLTLVQWEGETLQEPWLSHFWWSLLSEMTRKWKVSADKVAHLHIHMSSVHWLYVQTRTESLWRHTLGDWVHAHSAIWSFVFSHGELHGHIYSKLDQQTNLKRSEFSARLHVDCQSFLVFLQLFLMASAGQIINTGFWNCTFAFLMNLEALSIFTCIQWSWQAVIEKSSKWMKALYKVSNSPQMPGS